MIHNIHNTIQIKTTSNLIQLYYHSRPISKVELVGVITSYANKVKKILITLDDGTGCISCNLYKYEDQITQDHHLKVGDLVTIQGTVSLIRNPEESSHEFIVNIKSIKIELDPNIETLHITSTILLTKSIYNSSVQGSISSSASISKSSNNHCETSVRLDED